MVEKLFGAERGKVRSRRTHGAIQDLKLASDEPLQLSRPTIDLWILHPDTSGNRVAKDSNCTRGIVV
eukprot:scaffold40069_cov74-Phaeocystis_antarctica.AAC.2